MRKLILARLCLLAFLSPRIIELWGVRDNWCQTRISQVRKRRLREPSDSGPKSHSELMKQVGPLTICPLTLLPHFGKNTDQSCGDYS